MARSAPSTESISVALIPRSLRKAADVGGRRWLPCSRRGRRARRSGVEALDGEIRREVGGVKATKITPTNAHNRNRPRVSQCCGASSPAAINEPAWLRAPARSGEVRPRDLRLRVSTLDGTSRSAPAPAPTRVPRPTRPASSWTAAGRGIRAGPGGRPCFPAGTMICMPALRIGLLKSYRAVRRR